MGLSLEFYAGDAEVIVADFTKIEFDGIRDGTRARAYADFSLHITPSDLDLLSQVIAEDIGSKMLTLNKNLIETAGGTEGESGAFIVASKWVKAIATANPSNSHKLTSTWIQRVGDACGEKLEVTEEAVRAVKQLILLCRIAEKEKLEVVHTWYL